MRLGYFSQHIGRTSSDVQAWIIGIVIIVLIILIVLGILNISQLLSLLKAAGG